MATTVFNNETSTNETLTMYQRDQEMCLALQCSVNVCSDLDLTVKCVQDFIFPTALEWMCIGLHLVIFTIGVVGNFLVCFVVLRSKHMQTMTNLFIVNLAVADAVILVLCSPPTVLQSVTETWFLGDAMCKVVLVFQNTVIGVSVLTLCAIAVERYFAICRPLRSRITMRKVTVTIVLIWVFSGAIASPNFGNYVLSSFVQPELSQYLQVCEIGMDEQMRDVYHLFLFFVFYIVPLTIIGIFYIIISNHLWHVKMPGTVLRECDSGPSYRSHAEVQLASRKKVAKMLIAIVVLFAACLFPINLIFLLKYMGILSALFQDSSITPIVFMLAHLLCYFNSAMNPLIYNFMSVKFKKEFRNVFHCRNRENTPLQYESTWFHSTRVVRHNISSNHSNPSGVRMLRAHDVNYPIVHRVSDGGHNMNGESV